jgi:hypothetical protein
MHQLPDVLHLPPPRPELADNLGCHYRFEQAFRKRQLGQSLGN